MFYILPEHIFSETLFFLLILEPILKNKYWVVS